MAPAGELPCDSDGVCMVCRQKPPPEEMIACSTCATPWHVPCLSPGSRPETRAVAVEWQCPDCAGTTAPGGDGGAGTSSAGAVGGDLVAAIREIERDDTLTEKEKAKKRQELLSGHGAGDALEGGKDKEKGNEALDILDRNINCSICIKLPERPVSVRILLLSDRRWLPRQQARIIENLLPRSFILMFQGIYSSNPPLYDE